MRFLIQSVLTVLLLSPLLACENLSNRYQKLAVDCGQGYDEALNFFPVIGPDGKRIAGEDLVVINNDPADASLPVISSKGCISQPIEGRYIVRAKKNDWAAVFSRDSTDNASQIRLRDFGDQQLAILCSEAEPWTVGKDFRFRSTVTTNVEPDLSSAYLMTFELKKDGTNLRQTNNLSLADASALPLFGLALDDGPYELMITVVNLLKDARKTSQTCRLNLDTTPPESVVQVNGMSTRKSVEVHSKVITSLEPSETISFKSRDDDVSVIQYCVQPVIDDFDESDLAAVAAWRESAEPKICPNPISIGLGQTITTQKNSGIWAIHYQSLDKAGNKSAPQTELVFFLSNDRLKLIKNVAVSEVQLLKLKKQPRTAIEQALQAESLRLQSTTQYERSYNWLDTLGGLLNAFNQDGVSYALEEFGDSTESVIALDDNTFISATGNFIRFWDIKTRKNFRSIDVGISISNMALSPDGKHIAISRDSDMVKIIDTSSGFATHVWKDVSGSINDLSFSPSGDQLIIAHRTFLSLWDLESDRSLKRFPASDLAGEDFESEKALKVVLVTQDGKRAISGGFGGFEIWDLDSGELLQKKNPGSAIYSMALSPDEKQLACGLGDGTTEIWDLSSGQLSMNLDNEVLGSIQAVSYSKDGQRLMAASGRSVIKIWDLNNLSGYRFLEEAFAFHNAATWTPDGRWLITGSSNRSPVLWSLDSGYQAESVLVDEALPETRGFGLSNDQKLLVALPDYDPRLILFDLEHGGSSSLIDGEESYKISLCIASDNRLAVTGSYGGKLEFWDLQKKSRIRLVSAHEGQIRSLAFSPDGSRLLSIATDGTVKVWASGSGELLKTLSLESAGSGLSVSPSGFFATSEANGTLSLWNMDSYKLLKSYSSPDASPTTIDISPDGRKIVSGSDRGSVRFWNLDTGDSYADPSDTMTSISNVRWLKNGEGVLSGSLDQSVRIWDPESGHFTAMWIATQSGVSGLTLSADGQSVFTGGGYNDRGIKIWNLSHDKLTKRLCSFINAEDFTACR